MKPLAAVVRKERDHWIDASGGSPRAARLLQDGERRVTKAARPCGGETDAALDPLLSRSTRAASPPPARASRRSPPPEGRARTLRRRRARRAPARAPHPDRLVADRLARVPTSPGSSRPRPGHASAPPSSSPPGSPASGGGSPLHRRLFRENLSGAKLPGSYEPKPVELRAARGQPRTRWSTTAGSSSPALERRGSDGVVRRPRSAGAGGTPRPRRRPRTAPPPPPHAGAAVYLGLPEFSAPPRRERRPAELARVVAFLHRRRVRAYWRSTLLREDELGFAACVDAAARRSSPRRPQDPARRLPGVALHLSTQTALFDRPALLAAARLGATRVVLRANFPAAAIRELAGFPMPSGCFVHGALCSAVSGICLLSSRAGERSGNRGLCAQCCRYDYSCGAPRPPPLDGRPAPRRRPPNARRRRRRFV
jgi:hypothetical protein